MTALSFERYAGPGDLDPPKGCAAHNGTLQSVLLCCGHPNAGRETRWPVQACPRCAITCDDYCDGLWAMWDGNAWVIDGAGESFRSAWLEQARQEGLIPDDLPADVLAPPPDDGYNGLSVAWALRALHPHLTYGDAVLLLCSTSIARRPRYGNDHLDHVPYTDLSALQALSEGTVGRWRAYHQAMLSVLSEHDIEMARVTGFFELHEHMDYVFWEDEHGQQRHSRVYDGVHAGYTKRLVDAHEIVTGTLGVEAPTHADRFQCHGDTFGDLEFDIALGLNDWLHGRPEWLPQG